MRYRHIFLLIAILLLGGCAAIFPEHGRHPPGSDGERYRAGSPEADIHAFAADAAGLSQMSPEAQRRELEAAELAFEKDDGPMKRLRLALLLTYANGELQDLDRAEELLAQAAAGGEPAADHGLGKLLATLVARMQAERRRTGAEQSAGDQAHQDSRLADSSLHRDELQRLQAKLAAERAQCRALEEQLESLREIERQINEREQPPSLPLDHDYDPTQDSAGR